MGTCTQTIWPKNRYKVIIGFTLMGMYIIYVAHTQNNVWKKKNAIVIRIFYIFFYISFLSRLTF